MKKISIFNGPNLNLLGTREPEVYGSQTLDDIKNLCLNFCNEYGLTLEFRQSNLEGELVNWIQSLEEEKNDGLILNAAAYTHTSLAIQDAMKTISIPIVEVHLSNVYKREEIRHTSLIASQSIGCICGFGAYGYILALQALLNLKS